MDNDRKECRICKVRQPKLQFRRDGHTMKTCTSCSSNKRTKAGFQRKKRVKRELDPEETERTCNKCSNTRPIADFRWDSRTWSSCRGCSTNKRVLLASERYWKRAKVEVPAEARSVKPRRARVHVVDYEKLKKIIQDEEGEGDVYIKFPIYMNDPAVDSATLTNMVEARARKAEPKPESAPSKVSKDSSDICESRDDSYEEDYDKDDRLGLKGDALEEPKACHGSARRSSRLVSKPRQNYNDGDNADMLNLNDTRPSRTFKKNPISHLSKNSTSARPQSTLASPRPESIEEISARVRVIGQFLKEEFEVFTNFKWNVRKALELKFRQDGVSARMTYYCGQIKGTGGALHDPSKRTGHGGRKSSTRYDCGGRLVFFINLTNEVCVVRYKHTAHPPRPGFSPVAIPDAVSKMMQKLAQEGELQNATGQEMYDYLVTKKLIRRKQIQPFRVALHWLQIRESMKTKSSTLSSSSASIQPRSRNVKIAPSSSYSTSVPRTNTIKSTATSSTSTPKAVIKTNTKNDTPGKLADTSPENNEEVAEEEEEEEQEQEDETKSEKSAEEDTAVEFKKERPDKEEKDEAQSEVEDDPTDDEGASEYEEAVESQSQERWATPDLIEEETEGPDLEMEMEMDQDSEMEEEDDSETEDFADQVKANESTAQHYWDTEAPPENYNAASQQRDIEDIVERMNMLEKNLVDATKTNAEIEAIEKELDLLNSFLTDMNF